MPDHLLWRPDEQPTLIGEGTARFTAWGPLPPSFALIAEPRPTGPVPRDFRSWPEFAEGDGRRWARLAIPPGTGLYGMGEGAGPLRRNSPDAKRSRVICWNTDQFEYDDTDESLYQSHPWVLGVRADGSAFGVLADTTHRCTIDWDGHLRFGVEGPPFALYIIERAGPAPVVEALASLTGTMPLPPRWALGYHQSRWSYEPDARVREIAAEFRTRRIPCDCLWLDIDYMDGFRCFTFDPVKFPDPRALNDHLHLHGFKTVWMIDPGIKVDPDYRVYAEGARGDHFLRTATGAEYRGKVWPGECAFPDFTREATRQWWAGLYEPFLATGLDGVWNDMNEPAVFDNDRKQMPEDNHHRADEGLGGPGPHARYHNVYGMLMVRASREGMQRARPGRRPFILTRSNFIGGHRYAATWTGDNVSDWAHLRWSIPMTLNMGLSGQPFVGPDVGGFSGECEPALYARWMGIGAMLPFARAHSIKDSKPHEPWGFGEAAERTCRLTLERRSRLIPYLYTLFHEASRTGLPIARPLFFADPLDPALREADDAFLLGLDLLVRARVTPDGPCTAPMPRSRWQRFEIVGEYWTDTALDPDLPELHIRAGAILPIGPVMQYDAEKPLDPLTLLVCLDDRGQAVGTLYEDAGDGYGYLNHDFRLTAFTARAEGGHIVVESSRTGRMPAADRVLEVVVFAGGMARTALGREGQPVVVPRM